MITPIKKTLQIFCIAVAVLVIGITAACNRNRECKAIVTVVRQATNEPLSGVTVTLTTDPSCTNCIDDLTATTDGSGKASFTTDLPKIMDILANSAVTGSVARFEEGETDEVTVKIP
ncbi:MAG: hypothetical protein MUC87_09280 [Bacteroidia bacterium]|jgi:hypothetical protein|nr:hypothetical protein [Bacteroidia bacterium]